MLTLASMGHRVVGCDADPEKLQFLVGGRMPFYEPGGQELLREQLAAGRLSFSSEIGDPVSGADGVFICVGTPPAVSGEVNLVAFGQAAREIARRATGPLIVVEKSTVPAVTASHLERTMLGERPDLKGGSM